MSYVRSNPFLERERWKEPLIYSFVFHVVLTIGMFLVAYIFGPRTGTNWGENTGDAVEVQLVSSAAPVAIPHPDEPTKNIVANESKGRTETPPPQPKPVETDDGISIPGKVKPQPKPKTVTNTATVVRPPRPTPTPETAVAYGEGGPVTGPYGTFSAPHTQGGVSFQNHPEFGSRFAYYGRIIDQTLSSNWFKPDVQSGRRVYLLFDITRDGSPANIRVEQSSGVPSLDQLAMRAVQRSNFPPLPAEYRESKLQVEFWFDYQK